MSESGEPVGRKEKAAEKQKVKPVKKQRGKPEKRPWWRLSDIPPNEKSAWGRVVAQAVLFVLDIVLRR